MRGENGVMTDKNGDFRRRAREEALLWRGLIFA